MLEKLNKIAEELERRMINSETKGRTITLKIKYSDFTQQTRSKTLPRIHSNERGDYEGGKRIIISGEIEELCSIIRDFFF